jgi:hypothetical protein
VIQANDFPTTDDREGNILDLPEADGVAIRAKARLRGHQKDSPARDRASAPAGKCAAPTGEIHHG